HRPCYTNPIHALHSCPARPTASPPTLDRSSRTQMNRRRTDQPRANTNEDDSRLASPPRTLKASAMSDSDSPVRGLGRYGAMGSERMKTIEGAAPKPERARPDSRRNATSSRRKLRFDSV